MAAPRIKLPKTITAGEVITIKTLVSHRMESGHRIDGEGKTIPRLIINRFSCEFNGMPVFSCDMNTGVAANPYFEFKARVEESGTFKFTWTDDEGEVIEADREITLL